MLNYEKQEQLYTSRKNDLYALPRYAEVSEVLAPTASLYQLTRDLSSRKGE